MTPSTTEGEAAAATSAVGSVQMSSPPEDRLIVAVRLRPHYTEDLRRVLYALDNKTVVVHEKDSSRQDVLRQKRLAERQYEFDQVLSEDASQEEVYEATTKALVQRVLRGGSATVLAYGATGSGKTYTMVGTAQQPGVMVRALDDLFRAATQPDEGDTPPRQVAMSYLEVYNEKIRDLLTPGTTQLELREDSQGGVRVAGLSEVFATSTEEVLRLLQRGNRARSVEPTAANRTSSRSHAMLQVSVMGRSVTEGRLLMVDLAGSERASQTKNRGKRLQEGAHINLSLLALGNCITALARGGDVRHINFRDSKLTRLLKGALTGGGRRLSCVMIAHVSPGNLQREESRTTLLYAERAARISLAAAQHNRPAGFAAAQATLRAEKKRLRAEIERLRNRLGDEEEDQTRPMEVQRYRDDMKAEEPTVQQQNELSEMKEQIVAAFRDQMRARRRLLEVDSQLLGLGMLAERQNLTLRRWEARHGQLYRTARLETAMSRSQRQPDHWHTDPEDSDISSSHRLDQEAQQAWRELSRISREQERLSALKASAQGELEASRQRAHALEQELSGRVGSAWGERELLALVCRVHELELERLEAHGAALAREHELRRRQSALQRHERQRQLCEQIITRQRQLMEERQLTLPAELQQLYSEYLREVHASSFSTQDAQLMLEGGGGLERTPPSQDERGQLPPLTATPTGFLTPSGPFLHSGMESSPRQRRHEADVLQLSTPTSSADSGRESPLPPIQEMSFSISQAMQLLEPSSSMSTSPLLPPIRQGRSSAKSHTSFGHPPAPPSRLPRPLPRKTRARNQIRRSVSDEDIRD